MMILKILPKDEHTILSIDNLEENGAILHFVVSDPDNDTVTDFETDKLYSYILKILGDATLTSSSELVKFIRSSVEGKLRNNENIVSISLAQDAVYDITVDINTIKKLVKEQINLLGVVN